MVNIFTFSRKARATSGNTSRPSAELKNAVFTRSQPGELTTENTITAKTATVLITAIDTFVTGLVPALEDAGAPPGDGPHGHYFRIGALALSESQVFWICASVPLALSAVRSPGRRTA